jgi:hypothetical protein
MLTGLWLLLPEPYKTGVQPIKRADCQPRLL